MKYLILFAFILLTISEDIKCPATKDASGFCTEEYIPVCGYSAEGYIQGTYSNGCFACQAEKVAYYQKDACQLESNSSSLLTTNPDSSTSSSTNSNTTITSSIVKCDSPKSDNLICPKTFNQTCGLFNSSIQCIKAPCGQVFGNECEACSNANVDRYFLGDCSNMPQDQTTTNPTQDEYVKCKDPRPEICTMEYTDVCAFTEFPCYSDTCMKEGGNLCAACSDVKVVGYIAKKCSDYALIYQTNGEQKLDDKADQQQDLIQTAALTKFECSLTRPTTCDATVNSVCAQFSCTDAICEKEFTNECYACADTSVVSYYRGSCQTSYGQFLGLALIISIIL